jgi:hypothetical protein
MSLVQLFAFAASFADTAKNAHACLMADHVVDHLGEQHRLAYACPAEKSSLAAAFQRYQYVDHLDARLEYLGFRGTLRERGRRLMYRAQLDIGRRILAIDRVSEHIEHSREYVLADRSH